MTSHKRLGLVALTLVGALISFTAYRWKRAPTPVDVEAPAPAAVEHSTSTTLRMLVAQPLTPPIPGESAEARTSSPECSSVETALLSLALDDFEYPPRIDRLPNPVGCKPTDARAAKILDYYSAKCADSFIALPPANLPEHQWKAKIGECQLATLMARSTFAVLARGKKDVREIEDLRELADRLISNFGAFFAESSTEEMVDMRKTADRMIELDPTLIPAHKAGAMATMLETLSAKEKGSKATPDWTDLDTRVREIQNRSPDDPDLDTFRRIADTEGLDPERVERDSVARLSRKPDDWRENWKVTQKPGSQPDDFKISMQVGVSFNEMLK